MKFVCRNIKKSHLSSQKCSMYLRNQHFKNLKVGTTLNMLRLMSIFFEFSRHNCRQLLKNIFIQILLSSSGSKNRH